MPLEIRPARDEDAAPLRALDGRSWSVIADVAPPADAEVPFFGPGRQASDVLVAEVDRSLIGWVKLSPPTPLDSNAHVQQVQGLAVDPANRGRGTGRALIEAALDLARRRGARKVTLRVLSTNEPAQRLYRSAGFVVEGVLVDEFFLAGRYVDDVLMARFL